MSTTIERAPPRLDPPATRTARVVKRTLAGVALLLAVLIVTVALLPANVWKRIITHVASSDLGRRVSIDGKVEVHVFTWNPRVLMEGLRVANADWAPKRPMLRVRRLEVTVHLLSLFEPALVFPRIEIDAPDIDLLRDSSSRANWDFSTPGAKKPQKPGASAPTKIPVIKQFILADGVLVASDQVRKLTFNGQIAVNEGARSADQALRMHGSGVLNGKPFELRLDGAPLINSDHSKPYEFDVAVSAADIKLTAHTNIAHPFDLGEVAAKFHLAGKDLADAFYLTGLALPNTPPYDLSGTAVRNGMKFTVDDFRGRLGSSDINGKLSVDSGHERPFLSAQLNSSSLNLADLAAPLGTRAVPENKADTLAGDTAAGPVAGPDASKNALLLPDADLQVARVRAMDADVQFVADSINTAKFPMKKVQFHLKLDDGMLTMDPLTFTLPEGRFSGSVKLNARPAVPVTDIDMTLKNLDLAQFKPGSSSTPPLSGDVVGRLQLHGAGSSVHKAAADARGDITVVIPKGEMRAAFAELTGINVASGLGLLIAKKDEDTDIRCGVVSFHADDGDLKATTMVLDTGRVLITGGGGVQLGSEKIDLSLRGQPKGIRLVRLRSPIEIRGTLLHPTIGVRTLDVVAQTGGAIALGVVLTPVASLLAFVDPGLAKDANCADLVAQTSQDKGLPAAK